MRQNCTAAFEWTRYTSTLLYLQVKAPVVFFLIISSRPSIIIIGCHPQNEVWRLADGIPRDDERPLLVGDTLVQSRSRCHLSTRFVVVSSCQVFFFLKEASGIYVTIHVKLIRLNTYIFLYIIYMFGQLKF